MKEPASSRPFVTLINTYEERDECVDAAAEWLKGMHEGLVSSLLESISTLEGEASADLGLFVRRASGYTSENPWTEGRWKSALKELAAGNIDRLTIDIYVDALTLSHRRITGSLDVNFSGVSWPELGHTISAYFPEELMEIMGWRAAQDEIVGGIKEVATAVRAATGFGATEGPVVGIATAYEERVGALDMRPYHFRQRVRGPYWAIFLSGGHLHALGGRGLLDRAPTAVVQDLSSEGHELIYLQLSHDARSIAPQEQRALEDFLEPVLPKPVSEGLEVSVSDDAVRTAASAVMEVTANGPDVRIAVVLPPSASAEDQTEVEGLVSAWLQIGFYGGFGGKAHEFSEVERTRTDAFRASLWTADLGSLSEEAFPVLRAAVSGWAKDSQTPDVKVSINDIEVESPLLD